MDSVKNNGRIYTPANIVNILLDYAGYVPTRAIQKKHVMDNSCGDGRILCEVVRRYIKSCWNDKNLYGKDLDFFHKMICIELKKYIHGIELDEIECQRCKDNLNAVMKEFGLDSVEWDITCGDALYYLEDFRGRMDYVFGNPPYVRMKNIKKSDANNMEYQKLKQYSFASKGMSDLYLAFYELGLKMRKETGILCYITPSSWINSSSGEIMRKYVWETRELAGVIDFEHNQVFEDATTYVMIALFDNRPHKFIRYDLYDFMSEEGIETDDAYDYEDVFIDGKMYFNGCHLVKKVFEGSKNKKVVEVKNGYATLADDVFIDGIPDFKHFTIDVVKASTGQWKKCLFPYDNNLNLIPLETIRQVDQDVYDYLILHQDVLKKRTYDSKGVPGTWHSFGRSQGLRDTFEEKVVVNCLVKRPSDVKLVDAMSGDGAYGGLYIKTELSAYELQGVLGTTEFIRYVEALRKYKSGGYYTFSSKDLERYLNYKLDLPLFTS